MALDPPESATAVGRFSRAEIVDRTTAIRRDLGAAADALAAADFERFTAADLERLFAAYDERFFGGDLAARIGRRGASLDFFLSTRMTRAGGRTRVHLDTFRSRFEILVSSYLLGLSFADVDRPVAVNGIPCGDRVDALLRIFEHELIHLLEFLRWGRSSCGRRRFRGLARDLFGHTEFGHRLVTQVERARVLYDVAVGDRVSFELEGRRQRGFVNRITKRATVLVRDRRGRRYSDGRRYRKFYVPLTALTRADS